MLTVFFDYRGVVHYEFLPTSQTVKKEYSLSVMRHLREAIPKNGPELTIQKQFLDFAPQYCSDSFAKNSTHIHTQPPYSPDLTSCDFWLFPEL